MADLKLSVHPYPLELNETESDFEIAWKNALTGPVLGTPDWDKLNRFPIVEQVVTRLQTHMVEFASALVFLYDPEPPHMPE